MELHIYGLVIGVGIVVAMTVAERVGGGRVPVWEVFWYMVLPALIAARLYHVVDKWDYYQENIWQIGELMNGGLAIWGAVAGGVGGLYVYSRLRARKMESKVTEEFFMAADVMGLVAPLAQAIGRWGNYANQELWGRAAEGLPWERHPLFLYESVMNLILFVILMFVYHRRVRGSTFGSYLLGYGLIRVILEPLREESFVVGEVRVAQLVGMIAILLGVMILWRKGRKVWR